MRPVSAGRVIGTAVPTRHNNTTKVMTSCLAPPTRREEVRPVVTSIPLYRCGVSELHLRWRLRIFGCGKLGHRLVGAEHGGGPQHAREGPEFGVVQPHRLNIVPPSYRNAVFGALELRL